MSGERKGSGADASRQLNLADKLKHRAIEAVPTSLVRLGIPGSVTDESRLTVDKAQFVVMGDGSLSVACVYVNPEITADAYGQLTESQRRALGERALSVNPVISLTTGRVETQFTARLPISDTFGNNCSVIDSVAGGMRILNEISAPLALDSGLVAAARALHVAARERVATAITQARNTGV